MRWHLAQINMARAVAPLDSPALADFIAQIAGINALAEQAPGFVWRWPDQPPPGFDPQMLLNLSVWQSIDALADFTYQSAHGQIFRQRRQWFEAATGPRYALWWVEAGVRPEVEEGFARLARLEAEGPTAAAFTFARRFPPPD
jgi:hypothetical protein